MEVKAASASKRRSIQNEILDSHRPTPKPAPETKKQPESTDAAVVKLSSPKRERIQQELLHLTKEPPKSEPKKSEVASSETEKVDAAKPRKRIQDEILDSKKPPEPTAKVTA